MQNNAWRSLWWLQMVVSITLEESRPPTVVLESAHLAGEPSFSAEPASERIDTVFVGRNVAGQLDFREAVQSIPSTDSVVAAVFLG